MHVNAQLTFSVLFNLVLQPIEWCHPNLMWLFPPQSINLELPLRHIQKFVSQWKLDPVKLTILTQPMIKGPVSQFFQLLSSQGNHISRPIWVVEVVRWEFIISLFHLVEEKKTTIQKCSVSHYWPYSQEIMGPESGPRPPDLQTSHDHHVLQ